MTTVAVAVDAPIAAMKSEEAVHLGSKSRVRIAKTMRNRGYYLILTMKAILIGEGLFAGGTAATWILFLTEEVHL